MKPSLYEWLSGDVSCSKKLLGVIKNQNHTHFGSLAHLGMVHSHSDLRFITNNLPFVPHIPDLRMKSLLGGALTFMVCFCGTTP